MLQPLPRRAREPAGREQARELRADVVHRVRKAPLQRREALLQPSALGLDARRRARDLLRDEREAATALVHTAREIRLGHGRRVGEERAVERRADHIGAERRDRGVLSHRAFQVANAVAKGDQKQPPHPVGMRLARLLRRLEHLQRDLVARVHQRRIADQRMPAALDLHDLGQLAHGPAGVALALVERRLFLQQRLRFLAERALDLDEIASHGTLASVVVRHAEVHAQVRRHRVGPEGIERHLQVELGADVARDGRGERRIGGFH